MNIRMTLVFAILAICHGCAAPALPIAATCATSGTGLGAIVATDVAVSSAIVAGTCYALKDVPTEIDVVDSVSDTTSGQIPAHCVPPYLACQETWRARFQRDFYGDGFEEDEAMAYCTRCYQHCERTGEWPVSVPLEPPPNGIAVMAIFDPGPFACTEP